jgi:hypothetical protein
VSWRQEIKFRSGFPDDAVDGDDIELQAGRNIADALKAALEKLDYRVSEAIDAGDHGWELDIWRERKRFWLQISALPPDECYLMTRNMAFWLWPGWDVYRSYLADLQRILQADSRVREIGWFPDGGLSRDMEPAEGPFDP